MAINANAQTSFDKVMDEYNEAFTSTNNQDSIHAIWEAKIDAASKVFDAEIEAQYQAEVKALAAEQKASEDEIKELEKQEEDSLEEGEDAENTNDNHPLVNTFKKLVREGVSAEDISKQFKEVELIEIGKEYDLAFTSKGSKLDKVKLIIEVILK